MDDDDEIVEVPLQKPLQEAFPGIGQGRAGVVLTTGTLPDLGIEWSTANSREFEQLVNAYWSDAPTVVQRTYWGTQEVGWSLADDQKIRGADLNAAASFIDGLKR